MFSIIGPIVTRFKRATGRDVHLRGGGVAVSTDSMAGGRGEFVVTDQISMWEDKTVFIIEPKRSSTENAMRQCFLSLKDARDINGGDALYGFVTAGQQWKITRYNGTSFLTTNLFLALSETMETDKVVRFKDYSIVVGCIFCALSMGGIVEE